MYRKTVQRLRFQRRRKCLAIHSIVSQDQPEEILTLRRTCIAIQKIVSQDSLLRKGGHAQRYIKSCCKTAVAQEGKRVYHKTNLSLAIQSHTKQLKAVSCNTVPRPTRRYNLAIQFIQIAIQNVHKTTISPTYLILQYNLKVKGVIQSWNTIKPSCDTTTHKTIPNPECRISKYSSQERHDTNSRYNDVVLKYILKGLTWTLSIRRSQYVAAATI